MAGIMKASIFFLFLSQAVAKDLQYTPAPPDNPLRGLVPYVGNGVEGAFPHSMEFQYFALSELMTGWGSYDWMPLESKLEEVRKRGKQLVFRVYCEYPGKSDGFPAFLKAEGVRVTAWHADGLNLTPDYGNPVVRKAMSRFITAMGAKYDGDPRVAFITAGMLGRWGEWHDDPRNDHWAPEVTQVEVMDAFATAFRKTQVLLRYPSAGRGGAVAANVDRAFGYHDDSFGWATLDAGNEDKRWHFMALMNAAGAGEKWKLVPIGGEIRPELWETEFTGKPTKSGQDFAACVEQTHASWLLDSGMFSKSALADERRVARALRETGRMGYELYISSATLDKGQLTLVVENRGVAPFYDAWPVEAEAGGKHLDQKWQVTGILPGMPVRWTAEVANNSGMIRIRIPNPMAGGKPLRFANRETEGEWLVLDAGQL